MENNQLNGKESQKKSSVFTFTLFTELALEIAVILTVPLIGGIYLGKWLNTKYDSKIFLVLCVILAIAFSWYVVIRKIITIKKLISK